MQNSYDIAGSEGPSDYDARHRFVVNAIYDLPFKGNRLVEGWQLGLIFQAQSGNPINIVTNVGDVQRRDQHAQTRPGRRSSRCSKIPISGSARRVCDPRVAIALPVRAPQIRCSRCRCRPTASFHFGNLPRNAIRGPGFGTADLSIIKNTRLSAAARVQLRLEVFNLFNQANFGQPGRIATVGSTSLRGHHQHPVPDRRLGIVAADSTGGEVSLLSAQVSPQAFFHWRRGPTPAAN